MLRAKQWHHAHFNNFSWDWIETIDLYGWFWDIAFLLCFYVRLVVWNIFSHILGIIIPVEWHFSEGSKPPTRYVLVRSMRAPDKTWSGLPTASPCRSRPHMICGEIWKDTIPSSCPPYYWRSPHGPKYEWIPYHAVWVVFDIMWKEVLCLRHPVLPTPATTLNTFPRPCSFGCCWLSYSLVVMAILGKIWVEPAKIYPIVMY